MRLLPVLFSLPCLLLLPPVGAPALAQDAVDVQLWTQAVAIVNVSANWRVHVEEQPRWNDNISQTFQVLTRTAVGRRINDRLTLWAGHGWIAKPPTPGIAHEQRLWQQASINFAATRWVPALRFRQEQRWQGEWADVSHRLRVMGRVVSSAAPERWGAVFSNEAMFTFDETPAGPIQGFDQNRLFGGALYRFATRHWVEFGGFWVASNADGSSRHDYVQYVGVNLFY